MTIGRNRNVNPTANVPDAIALNTSTSTIIAAANPDRTYFIVCNPNEGMDAFIKLQPASTDNDKKGIPLSRIIRAQSRWEMPRDNIYPGEISAIADNGALEIFITEY